LKKKVRVSATFVKIVLHVRTKIFGRIKIQNRPQIKGTSKFKILNLPQIFIINISFIKLTSIDNEIAEYIGFIKEIIRKKMEGDKDESLDKLLFEFNDSIKRLDVRRTELLKEFLKSKSDLLLFYFEFK